VLLILTIAVVENYRREEQIELLAAALCLNV